MLEIKNVTKIYKSKGGAETKALDDVSISFGETGLIFLLGKSGSGKSTLLNVSGGLDEPTSGEIVVKGKSSKDFTPSDFDSYRNTFVGFVFQEYNVLDEFNVEDNIALALELQGKPKDKEKIHGLLRDVELEDFAKRKPNTLSGGQKQRIAIARALIKDPQIIMADEPTGALDSATGKQVLDTLKKLSETRLVIVVSHDREFAETYGDRIVELKDGRIISDVSKTVIPPRAVDENVTVIGKDTLSIKRGSKLSAANVKTIEDFVSGCDGDVIITRGERQITAFKKANRMSDSGHTETFGETDPASLDVREYEDSERTFIRSRLPASKALKIGASGLRLKPFRLVLTILLSVVAFVMFGLFSTLMVYDGDKVAKSSYMNSDYDFIKLSKYFSIRYKDGNETTTSSAPTYFTNDDVKELAAKYGNSTFGYFSDDYDYRGIKIDNARVKDDKEYYYRAEVGKFAYIPENNSLRGKMSGDYPQKEDEICVSSYVAETLTAANSELYKIAYTDNGELYYSGKESVNTKSDVIGKYIVLSLLNNRIAFKITGVFECEKVDGRFNELKDGDNNELSWQYVDYINDGMFLMAFVSEDFAKNSDKYFAKVGTNDNRRYFINHNNYLEYEYTWTDEWEYTGDLGSYAKNYGGEAADGIKSFFLGGGSKTSLGENETIVTVTHMARIMQQEIVDYYAQLAQSGGFDGELELPVKKGESDLRYDDWDTDRQNGYYVIYDRDTIYTWDKYYDYGEYCAAYDEECQSLIRIFATRKFEDLFWCAATAYEDGKYAKKVDDFGYNYETVKVTQEERLAALDYIVSVTNNLQPKQFELIVDKHTRVNFTLVGFHEEDIYHVSDTKDGAFFSQSFIDEYLDMNKWSTTEKETNYVYEDDAIYKGVFVEYDRSERVTDALLASVGEKNKKANDVYYEIENSLSAAISGVNDYAATLSTVFLCVGVVFAVFAALLLFNFISMSISNKRKEIGILRAVGARGTDVFKIFFAESGIITGICTVLAVIGTIILCAVINGLLKTKLGLEVTLFVFGIASLAMMIGIALLVALVSTFLPVYFAARKKPVDSIRAL